MGQIRGMPEKLSILIGGESWFRLPLAALARMRRFRACLLLTGAFLHLSQLNAFTRARPFRVSGSNRPGHSGSAFPKLGSSVGHYSVIQDQQARPLSSDQQQVGSAGQSSRIRPVGQNQVRPVKIRPSGQSGSQPVAAHSCFPHLIEGGVQPYMCG